MANITIVATGGTRAPTQLELAARFVRDGHQVRCIATRAALRFLTAHMLRRPGSIVDYARRFRPQLLETLAYYVEKPKSVPHIAEGRWGDVFVMCPASCNSVGKLASGIGDNYALQVLRAVPRDKRVIVVPSMNPEMWYDPQFQRNVDLLNATEKYRVVCPSRGSMLSGELGFGAQAPLDDIVAETYAALGLLAPDVEALLEGRGSVPWESEHRLGDPDEIDIVMVDEDATVRGELAHRLEREHPTFRIHQFARPGPALAWMSEHSAPSLVVTELVFSGGAMGNDLIEQLRRPGADGGVQIIATTAADRREAGAERLARQEVLFLPKPLNISFAVGMIAGCLNAAHRGAPSRRRVVAAGDVLFHEGDEGMELYVVESGRFRVLKNDGSREVELTTIGERELVGEMALLGEPTRSATVVAAEPSTVIEVDGDRALAYFERQPVWLRVMVETLVRRVRTMNERAVE